MSNLEKKYNILFGISGLEEKEASLFVRELESRGIVIDRYDCKYKKIGISKYLSDYPDTDIVLVSQHLEERSPYTEHDFEYLSDNFEKVLFIPIIPDQEMGGYLVNGLYSLGICNGLFDADADFQHIVELIHKKRTRKEAKLYYGVKDKYEEMNSLDYESTSKFLENCDVDKLEDRVEHVLNMTSAQEFRVVLGMLSKERYELLSRIENDKLVPFFLNENGSQKKEKKKNRREGSSFFSFTKRRASNVTQNSNIKNKEPERVDKIINKGIIAAMILVLTVLVLFTLTIFSGADESGVSDSAPAPTIVVSYEPVVTMMPTNTPSPMPTPTSTPFATKSAKPQKTSKPKKKKVTTPSPKKEKSSYVPKRKEPKQKKSSEKVKPNTEELLEGIN